MDASVNGPRISLIVAASQNNVIGRDGEIPWHLPEDLKRFKELTKRHVVIMGRKTWDSIIARNGKPLPERFSIVVTRQRASFEGALAASSLKDAFEQARRIEKEEIFVIGGSEVYATALPYAQRIYLTHIHSGIPDGDAFFPYIHPNEWEKKFDDYAPGKGVTYDSSYFTFDRIAEPRKWGGPFILMEHARTDEQRSVTQKILKAGVCPFCPEHLHAYHTNDILLSGVHWVITTADYPYKNTRHHFLLIARYHAETLNDIPPEGMQELFSHLQYIEKAYGIEGGAIGIRFGNPNLNGASVKHLHVHLIVADVTDDKDPNYQPVRFKMS